MITWAGERRDARHEAAAPGRPDVSSCGAPNFPMLVRRPWPLNDAAGRHLARMPQSISGLLRAFPNTSRTCCASLVLCVVSGLAKGDSQAGRWR